MTCPREVNHGDVGHFVKIKKQGYGLNAGDEVTVFVVECRPTYFITRDPHKKGMQTAVHYPHRWWRAVTQPMPPENTP